VAENVRDNNVLYSNKNQIKALPKKILQMASVLNYDNVFGQKMHHLQYNADIILARVASPYYFVIQVDTLVFL